MPQINSGKSPPWVAGEIVTAAGLNGMIDAATLDPSAITAKTNLATLTGDEYALIVDTTGALKKTQLKNNLLAGNDVKTNLINQVTGASAVLTIESNAGVNTLIYSGGQLNLESGNGTQVNITSMGGSLTGTINLEAGNGMTFDGNTGTIDFLSSVSFVGGSIQGTANFTGALQVNGTVGYMLTEIVEQTVSPSTATSVANNYVVLFTSASYTKPSDEIWHIEIIGALQYNSYGYIAYKLKRTSGAVDLIGTFDVDHGVTPYDRMAPLSLSAVENTGTSFTSTYTFEMSFNLTGYTLGVGQTTSVNPSLTITIPATKFRIYKYKTA